MRYPSNSNITPTALPQLTTTVTQLTTSVHLLLPLNTITYHHSPFDSHPPFKTNYFKMKTFAITAALVAFATGAVAANCDGGLSYCSSSLLQKGMLAPRQIIGKKSPKNHRLTRD
jgi:heme A synthase